MKMTKFVDIGTNLLDDMFFGIYREKSHHAPDIQAVIQRARDAGAVKLFVTAGNVEESRRALRFVREDGTGFLKTTVRCLKKQEND